MITKMKKKYYLALAILCVCSLTLGFASCGDDDPVTQQEEKPNDPENPDDPDDPENPNDPDEPAASSPIARVFGDRPLKTLHDEEFVYEGGFLTTIIEHDIYNVTPAPDDFTYFHYNTEGTPDVYTADEDGMKQTATLNEQGFVASVHHEVYDCITTFTYDAEGHITHISDGREEREHELTWEDGDLVRVAWWRYSEDPSEAHVYTYTYSDEPTNGIMRFYNDYNMDLDVVEQFYYAGLMGIPPLHLIATETDRDGNVTHYLWTENSQYKYEGEFDPNAEPDITFSFYE